MRRQTISTRDEMGEQIILANPDSALNILNHLNKQIKSRPGSTRMYYEVLLCRAQDLCYFTHKSDETMKKAVEYYKDKKNTTNCYRRITVWDASIGILGMRQRQSRELSKGIRT